MSTFHLATVRVLSFVVALGGAGISPVSAQSAAAGAGDFSGIGTSRKVVVVDDAGAETRGRVLRVSPDQLTLAVDDRSVVFDRARVATVHALGDPLKNGMLIGLAIGGTFGILAGAVGTECGGFFEAVRKCSPAEKFRLGAVGGAVFGAVGLGLGAAVDRVISRRTELYRRRAPASAMVLTVVPTVAPTRVSLRLAASW